MALSVSISTKFWSSLTKAPSWTSHLTISASAMPSPMSGRRNSLAMPLLCKAGLEIHHSINCVNYSADVGQIELLQFGQRRDGVKAGHSFDRSFEIDQRHFIDASDNFCTDAAASWRLVNDHGSLRFFNRINERVTIQRRQGAQVDDFRADSFGRDQFGGLERDMQHRAPCDQGDVTAVTYNPGTI